MARPPFIELGTPRAKTRIPILYEDRAALAIDKPAGWMLVPFSWQRTPRNLQAAVISSIAARDFWAKSRNLKFLRHVHRLDAETTGILLWAKSQGALDTLSALFESRRMTKTYLAVVRGQPRSWRWTCEASLAPDPRRIGRMVVDSDGGKPAATVFRVVGSNAGFSLIEARLLTGRTHQIRVHLLEAGHPVVGDELYGPPAASRPRPGRAPGRFSLGLRAVRLEYLDPFRREPVRITAPAEAFLRAFGLAPDLWPDRPSPALA
ncbi:MAG: RNA pseudouridine synthase [Verrucomicrobia bacterium]|nr:RNA pseudouridine synthase [Verrucomicrobiota bacterium]